jgi:hypothetical protein
MLAFHRAIWKLEDVSKKQQLPRQREPRVLSGQKLCSLLLRDYF